MKKIRAFYNEIDPFCAAWLRNLMRAGAIPEGEIDTRSIVDVRADDVRSFRQCHFFAGISEDRDRRWGSSFGRAGRDRWDTGSKPSLASGSYAMTAIRLYAPVPAYARHLKRGFHHSFRKRAARADWCGKSGSGCHRATSWLFCGRDKSPAVVVSSHGTPLPTWHCWRDGIHLSRAIYCADLGQFRRSSRKCDIRANAREALDAFVANVPCSAANSTSGVCAIRAFLRRTRRILVAQSSAYNATYSPIFQ